MDNKIFFENGDRMTSKITRKSTKPVSLKTEPPKVEEKEPTLIEMRVSRSCIRLVRFMQTTIPYGQICFKTVNGEPTELVPDHTFPSVRFDKPQALPSTYVNFGDNQDGK